MFYELGKGYVVDGNRMGIVDEVLKGIDRLVINIDPVNKEGFDILNSLTKYPSIYTYHPLSRGIVQEELNEGLGFKENEFNITEKVDGTNSRIVIYQGDYVIGTREELIYSRGDRVIDPSDLVTNSLLKLAEELAINPKYNNDSVFVFYFETYGGGIQNKVSKNYTSDQSLKGIRLFDITEMEISEIMDITGSMTRDQLSGWRQRDRKRFKDRNEVNAICKELRIWSVPYLESNTPIPTAIKDILPWLEQYRKTKVSIDGTIGNSEGIIVRSNDNQLVRKIRFEDYELHEKRIAEKERAEARRKK